MDRNCIFSGNQPYGIHNGVDGLMSGEILPISWAEVTGWIAEVSLIASSDCTYLFQSYCILKSTTTMHYSAGMRKFSDRRPDLTSRISLNAGYQTIVTHYTAGFPCFWKKLICRTKRKLEIYKLLYKF